MYSFQLKISLILILLSVLSYTSVFAQDLDSLLESELGKTTEIINSTFKSNKIINGHSVEQMQKKGLDFRISHRFGNIKNGSQDLYGIDQASSYFSAEYGLFKNLNIGIGRASYKKTFNSFFKTKILKQQKGEKNIPITLSWITSMAINSITWADTNRTNRFSSRIAYTHQLLIAKKFNEKLSLQLTPSLLHRNLVETKSINNDIYALGIAGRYKLSNRISVNIEYFYTYGLQSIYHDPLSVGVDIQVGSHVFQLFMSNASSITENAFIGETTDNWKNGDIHFGFNISQVFSFSK